MDTTFYVIVNDGEHSGFVKPMDEEQAWTGSNRDGWTYQQLCGPHGSVYGSYKDEATANKALAKYLECGSQEQETYCYSHNPFVR